MRLVVLVNDALGLEPGQSTADLALVAARRGHEVWLAGVGGLGLEPGDAVSLRARAVPPLADGPALVAALPGQPERARTLVPGDVVLVRTNPARDPARALAHEVSLELLALAAERGVVVLSAPTGLMRARSKLYLATLPPAVRPRTLVSRDPAVLKAFVREAPGATVLKPLRGTHGQDVFLLEPGERRNLGQIVDVLVRGGFVMAQDFVPEAVRGDVRLLLLEGRLMEVDGRAAAVRRVPGKEDFRSNVHAGGHPEAVALTPGMRAVAEAVGPRLVADGLFLVGLDLIGDKVVEANVFSPGGLAAAGEFVGADFFTAVIEAVEGRA